MSSDVNPHNLQFNSFKFLLFDRSRLVIWLPAQNKSSKFEKVEAGEVDDRGYFKIVEVK